MITSEPLKLKSTLPVGPLRDTVIFPGNSVPIISGRAKSKAAVDAAWNSDKLILFIAQKNSKIEEPGEKDLYSVGTVCLIRRVVKNPGGEYTLSAEGIARVYIGVHFPIDILGGAVVGFLSCLIARKIIRLLKNKLF